MIDNNETVDHSPNTVALKSPNKEKLAKDSKLLTFRQDTESLNDVKSSRKGRNTFLQFGNNQTYDSIEPGSFLMAEKFNLQELNKSNLFDRSVLNDHSNTSKENTHRKHSMKNLRKVKSFTYNLDNENNFRKLNLSACNKKPDFINEPDVDRKRESRIVPKIRNFHNALYNTNEKRFRHNENFFSSTIEVNLNRNEDRQSNPSIGKYMHLFTDVSKQNYSQPNSKRRRSSIDTEGDISNMRNISHSRKSSQYDARFHSHTRNNSYVNVNIDASVNK